ncbi:acyl-CoA N-acyltransferase [Podospora fimiseda]|uniref:Acyl-CoA N-acyltransferase n=1 Tax=Podospora fimiseda TaxID=252190 RepID=A0AAN6YP27_9PEZI|nr:acyl-CoA N-acyltransferase [Podospora fimiseda]
MISLTFRTATPSDAPKIQPLVQSAYRGESSRKGWTTEADLLTGTRIDIPGITTKILTPNSAVLLAYTTTQENEELIACCEVLQKSSDTAYFGMFAVDPERQAGGIGKQVLAYAEEYARRNYGVKKMEMTVIGVRKELIGWYRRRGYRDTGKRGEFPVEEVKGMGGHAVRDWKELGFVVLEKGL